MKQNTAKQSEKQKWIDGLRGLTEWIETCPDELVDTFYATPFYLFVRNADELSVAARAILSTEDAKAASEASHV